MKQTKRLYFVSGFLAAGLVAIYFMYTPSVNVQSNKSVPTTSYGAFLAAQHALYTNNFDKAGEFLDNIDKSAYKYKSVEEIRALTDFLNGIIPDDVSNINKQKTLVSRVIVDANLVKNNKWKEMYDKHKNDNMRLMSPFRIWSGVAINHISETMRFIDKLETNPSWQSFLRGQIYAEQGKVQKAADAFDNVAPEFMNINDYLYIMSFYKHNNLTANANLLRTKFTTRPGSMFMVTYTDVPDWSLYAGYKNQLAFNLVQTVSHTQSMSHSDLSLLLLHFAANVADKNQMQSDAINYHSGLYMVHTMGNFDKYFSKIDKASPYYPFVNLRLAELTKDETAVRRAIDAQPLFVPAVNQLVNWQTQRGDKKVALQTINKTLENTDISINAKAYLYKLRAEVNLIFNDIDAAQNDINSATILIQKPDPDVFSIQARIWAKRSENLDKAYAYSLSVVQFAPGDSCAWDTLGQVIRAREGVNEALDILHRVAEVANNCSPLFEHMGDMYIEIGDKKLARDAYLRAIELSDDGLSIKPNLEKKLKKAE